MSKLIRSLSYIFLAILMLSTNIISSDIVLADDEEIVVIDQNENEKNNIDDSLEIIEESNEVEDAELSIEEESVPVTEDSDIYFIRKTVSVQKPLTLK